MDAGPKMFVVAGTLVPDTSWMRLPGVARGLCKKLFGFSPDRLIADTLYRPLKREGACWVVPLQWLGLASPDASYAAVKRVFLKAAQASGGKPIFVKGQSQGGLYALELALDPETRRFVSVVEIDGCPINGTMVLRTRRLGWAKRFPGVREMDPDSPRLADLRRRMRRSWPKRIPLIIVATRHDRLVQPWESALDVRLPKDRDLRRYLLATERPDGIDADVKCVEARQPVGHMWMEWFAEVRDIGSVIQEELAEAADTVLRRAA